MKKSKQELIKEIVKNSKTEFSEEQLERFKKAAEILAKNKKDCEKFKERDGI